MPEMESDNIIKTVNFKKARPFLNKLSLGSEYWYPYPSFWIYRGQRKLEWKLKPSALRPHSWSWSPFYEKLKNKYILNSDRLNLELNTVWDFAVGADRQGLHVPVFDHSWLDSNEQVKKFEVLKDVYNKKKTFPLPEWGPLFGMAQHYGIPTRLLDWTESASIAAYFAAYEAARLFTEKEKGIGRQEDIGKQIVVWAININVFEKISIPNEEELHVVRAPWASNPNLRAQRGLFTLHHKKIDPNDTVDLEKVDGLDEAIVRLIKGNKTERFSKPVMYRLQLPIENSPRLLYLLYQKGINAASVFPGYGGVTKSLKELVCHKQPKGYLKKYMQSINQNLKDKQ